MINYKTQLNELKKGCDLCVGVETPSPVFIYCDSCQAKISLLSQIISDLKKEWQEIHRVADKTFGSYSLRFLYGQAKVIGKITGMSSEELKEVKQ